MIQSELDVLLIKMQDPALRTDLKTQIDRMKHRWTLGLVFKHPGASPVPRALW